MDVLGGYDKGKEEHDDKLHTTHSLPLCVNTIVVKTNTVSPRGVGGMEDVQTKSHQNIEDTTNDLRNEKEHDSHLAANNRPLSIQVEKQESFKTPMLVESVSLFDLNEPNTHDNTKPNTQDNTKPNTQDNTKPKTEDNTKPKTQDNTKPKTQDNTKPNTQDNTKPNTQDNTKPNTQDNTKPNTQDNTKPNTQDNTKPNNEAPTEGPIEGKTQTLSSNGPSFGSDDKHQGNIEQVTGFNALSMCQSRNDEEHTKQLSLSKHCTSGGMQKEWESTYDNVSGLVEKLKRVRERCDGLVVHSKRPRTEGAVVGMSLHTITPSSTSQDNYDNLYQKHIEANKMLKVREDEIGRLLKENCHLASQVQGKEVERKKIESEMIPLQLAYAHVQSQGGSDLQGNISLLKNENEQLTKQNTQRENEYLTQIQLLQQQNDAFQKTISEQTQRLDKATQLLVFYVNRAKHAIETLQIKPSGNGTLQNGNAAEMSLVAKAEHVAKSFAKVWEVFSRCLPLEEMEWEGDDDSAEVDGSSHQQGVGDVGSNAAGRSGMHNKNGGGNAASGRGNT